ncbi:MAG: DegT/DnrJ/EryC1/StrS aminotransferase family protein [Spirochaetes bacterium]|nr:DegT/DnrJ/EryC1/StrS aminotransferase family protein [Spirochaetota bacterium]
MEKLAVNGGKPTRKKFLVFGSPLISNDEINEVVKTLRSGWIGTGPKVARFEENFKKYIGAKYAVAVSSCTAGLHLSMLVSGVKEGDEVITTPMTFVATINSITHTGAKPILVDIKRETLNIDTDLIEKKIKKKTKAILPVHFAGRACNMKKINDLAKKYKLKIINDAAHAIETEYNNKKIGTFGDLTAYSFYVTKNIMTAEGGMIVTDNEKYANMIKIYALHGMSKDAWKRFSDEGFKHYFVVTPGFKYNMTDIQASLGIHQLEKIEKYAKRREAIWQFYNKEFKDLPLILPSPAGKNEFHAKHLYTILVQLEKLKVSRDKILSALQKEGIGVGVHYLAIHLHPYYKEKYKFRYGDFPEAEFVSERTISLPFSPKLTDSDIIDVSKAVRKVISWFSK